jgi:hypothetical protein
MPTPYTSDINMLTSGNICGYQVQLNNLNANGAFTVKVLTQNAFAYSASMLVSAAAVLALF